MRRGPLLAVAALALVAVVAAAFVLTRDSGGDSAQLQALKDDPMGSYEPPGATLERSTATAERSTGTFSKAQPAKLSRVFSVPGANAGQAMQAAVATARAAGWKLSETRGGLGATGTKELATGPAILTVSLSQRAATARLQIALEHVQV